MSRRIRVVHFLNQFFAGVGGEAFADHPFETREGPLGPGRKLSSLLAEEAVIAHTVLAGDNYVADRPEEAVTEAATLLAELEGDVLVAGPAFSSGRFGIACVTACRAAAAIGRPGVCGLHPGNPAVALGRLHNVYMVPTGASVTAMNAALAQMARFALKLASGTELGPSAVEGYLPRGVRRVGVRNLPGHARAIKMLRAKLSSQPYVTELALTSSPLYEAASLLPHLPQATVALISTAGLVPRGNPDQMPALRSTQYYAYALQPQTPLRASEWESVHAGFNTDSLNRNPNYGAPLDALVNLAAEGRLGAIHPVLFSLTGVWTQEPEAKAIGLSLARELKRQEVDAALLVAT